MSTGELGTRRAFSTMKIGRNVKDRKNGVVSLVTRRRLFKMAANLRIMSYTYRHTAPIFPRWRLYVVSLTLRPISNMQLYRPPLLLQPQFSPYNPSTPLPRQSCQTFVYAIILIVLLTER